MRAKEIGPFRTELVRRGMFAVGHNRAATRGKINDANAHPFWVDDKIVLVQNGTYKGDHSHHKQTEVDTEAVAHVIAENVDIGEALRKVNAAYALVCFNTETKTLHMIRNDERPLYLAWANQCLLWCSDPGFLYLAASRNNLTLTSAPTMLNPQELVSLKIENDQWNFSSEVIDAKYKEPPFRYTPSDNVYPMVPHRWRNPYGFIEDAEDVTPINNVRTKPQEVDHLLSEILLKKFPDVHMAANEIPKVKEKIYRWHLADTARNYPIQITDYEPANTHANCTTWHVWGEFAADHDVFPEKVVAHWFVYNKTEQEILNYTDVEFATAKISAVRSHIQNDKVGVITVFMQDVKQFETTQILHA